MKETKIEKLILDLSNRWEVSPEEAVDRLNSMNESEINKLINSMTKKFQIGGRAFGPNIPYGNYRIVNKETVILPKKSGITQTQIDSVYNAEQEAFQKRASELIPELEQKIVDLRDKMGWDKSQRVKPIPGIKMPVTNSDPQYSNSRNQKFENGGFIDCLRAGGTVSKCKCGCDKITKHQQTSVIGNEMPRRVDGPGRVGSEEIKKDGSKVSYLTRPGREGTTWYTEQIVRPQGDTLYTAWNTATPPMDRLNSTVYVTPTAYKNMSKFRQRFNEVVPKGWMDAFKVNGLRKGGEIKACGGSLPKKSKFKK